MQIQSTVSTARSKSAKTLYLRNNSLPQLIAVVFAIILASTNNRAEAQTIILGTSSSFAVLSNSTITNTGATVIIGDVGLSPGSAVVGFPPGVVVNGSTFAGDDIAAQAQADAVTAYNQLAALTVTPVVGNLTGQDLGGLTLAPGVYHFDSSAQLTGNLTLDGAGLYVFQITTTLLTTSGSSIILLNNADAGNLFFQIGSSATLGSDTNFAGNLVAFASDTLNTGASVFGRVFALNGATTFDFNAISNPALVPEPAIAVLLFGALALLIALGNRVGVIRYLSGNLTAFSRNI